MSPSSAFLLLTTLLVSFCFTHALPDICATPPATPCPLGIETNPFLQTIPNKEPQSNMVQLILSSPRELHFRVPFCRNCGFFLSFIPNINAFTYPTLLSNSELTSLTPQAISLLQSNWAEFWQNGASYCDQRAQGKLFGSWQVNTTFASQYISSPCTSTLIMHYPSVPVMNRHPELFQRIEVPGQHLQYRANLYVHAVHPFDVRDANEKFATTISTHPLIMNFPLQARVRLSHVSMFEAKEILVTTTPTMPFVLNVKLEVVPREHSTFLNMDSCRMDQTRSAFGMELRHTGSKLGVYAFELVATEERAQYQGEFIVACEAFSCGNRDHATMTSHQCENLAAPVEIAVQVDQTRPQEIVTTTRFTPEIDLYSGTKQNPFLESLFNEQTKSNKLVSTGSDYVSFGVRTMEVGATDFELSVNHLRMCAPTCVSMDLPQSEDTLQMVLVKDGALTEQVKSMPHQWFRLWKHKDMLQFGNVVHTAGWSLDVDALTSFRQSVYSFEIELRWKPIQYRSGRTDAESETMIDSPYEHAVLFKVFQLMPDEDSLSDSTVWYKDSDVLLSMSAGGGAIVLSVTVITILGALILAAFCCWCCLCSKHSRNAQRDSGVVPPPRTSSYRGSSSSSGGNRMNGGVSGGNRTSTSAAAAGNRMSDAGAKGTPGNRASSVQKSVRFSVEAPPSAPPSVPVYGSTE